MAWIKAREWITRSDVRKPPVRKRALFRIIPDEVFICNTLHCILSARVCVTRQLVTDAQRTKQSSRGQGTYHPHCDTRTCSLGRMVRQSIDPQQSGTWRGAGFGGRFAKGAGNPQHEALRRLRAEGLLDPVPSLDEPPDDCE